MNTFTARRVLRELSENMIPLLDDETYWPLAERIIACPGTLLTTNSTTLGDEASAESMDIIEDERDTREESDLMAMENLGLTKVRRTKESNPLDLPIGSIGTYKNHMSRSSWGLKLSWHADSQKIHGPTQEEAFDDLHPQFLKRILAADLYEKCTGNTKAVLWTKYPSIFYDEVRWLQGYTTRLSHYEETY